MKRHAVMLLQSAGAGIDGSEVIFGVFLDHCGTRDQAGRTTAFVLVHSLD